MGGGTLLGLAGETDVGLVPGFSGWISRSGTVHCRSGAMSFHVAPERLVGLHLVPGTFGLLNPLSHFLKWVFYCDHRFQERKWRPERLSSLCNTSE